MPRSMSEASRVSATCSSSPGPRSPVSGSTSSHGTSPGNVQSKDPERVNARPSQSTPISLKSSHSSLAAPNSPSGSTSFDGSPLAVPLYQFHRSFSPLGASVLRSMSGNTLIQYCPAPSSSSGASAAARSNVTSSSSMVTPSSPGAASNDHTSRC